MFSPTPSQSVDETNLDGAFVTLLNRMANFKKIANHFSLSDKKIPDLLLLWDTSKDMAVREEECARRLKMRIEDMKDLAELTGINPLANDLENDEPSFIKFMYITEELGMYFMLVAFIFLSDKVLITIG